MQYPALANNSEHLQVNFATRPLYMLGVTGYKVALCLAYLRILNNTQLVFRKITWGVLAFILISHLASTLVVGCNATTLVNASDCR